MSGIKTNSSLKNDFVRWILSEISKLVSESNESIPMPKPQKHKEYVLQEFKNKCPYTGKPLSMDDIELDHIIPFNKDYCGLHLRGNLVATSSETNNEKKSQNYKNFIKSFPGNAQNRIKKIQAYMKANGYDEDLFDSLRIQDFVNDQYKKFEQYLDEVMKALTKEMERINNQLKQPQKAK